jgi:hypothetical protein
MFDVCHNNYELGNSDESDEMNVRCRCSIYKCPQSSRERASAVTNLVKLAEVFFQTVTAMSGSVVQSTDCITQLRYS